MRLAQLGDGGHVKAVRPALTELQWKKRQCQRDAVDAEFGRSEPGREQKAVDLPAKKTQCGRNNQPTRELPLIMKKVLSIMLLIGVLSGCSSVISNSEGFYKDRPRRPINWREYMTD